MPNEIVTERLETLLLARLSTSANPPVVAGLAADSQRFAPAGADPARWRDRVAACLRDLEDRGVIDAERRLARPHELERRTGGPRVDRWPRWSERILPALALGVAADDARSHQRLAKRDAWSAAIATRAYGLWTKGPPPTLSQACDALVWRALGLAGAPKRCPTAVRSHFLATYIAIDPAPPDKMLRQLAANVIGAPRPDLKAFYVALIRIWLAGGELTAPPPAGPSRAGARAAPPAVEASLVDAVRSAARTARDGVFGDRKVFISSVWNSLRTTPAWSSLELDEFKQRLVSAHRKRELVLARADLVAAMDPALVAASETRTEGATFHFIVREPVQ